MRSLWTFDEMLEVVKLLDESLWSLDKSFSHWGRLMRVLLVVE